MKKYLVILLFVTSICLSQEEKSFKIGVKIVNLDKADSYKVPKSILFEFNGNTHLVNHYLDLAKKIRRQFKKEGVKAKFNYNLLGTNPLKSDMNSIPKKKFNFKDFDVVCKYNINNFKGWDDHLFRYRKQNYKANLILQKENEVLLKMTIDINTYYTISTQNKNTSKIILDNIK
jgi:hypothetical protein